MLEAVAFFLDGMRAVGDPMAVYGTVWFACWIAGHLTSVAAIVAASIAAGRLVMSTSK